MTSIFNTILKLKMHVLSLLKEHLLIGTIIDLLKDNGSMLHQIKSVLRYLLEMMRPNSNFFDR